MNDISIGFFFITKKKKKKKKTRAISRAGILSRFKSYAEVQELKDTSMYQYYATKTNDSLLKMLQKKSKSIIIKGSIELFMRLYETQKNLLFKHC
jgi:hypothetical protein